ncbi:hypothetical protein CVS54_00286 [Microbacterium oxydans]|uniref:Uncharacterized protein n=1 Tax=Microbacterium oxydans TaxID=82380 RepID=A0A3S9WFX8_9MICO|nr:MULTISPECIES: hypothetical protein [Microbacterium]AZS38989.1 hypothetical protein CVS54_00286 [Microbacterium oxydans]
MAVSIAFLSGWRCLGVLAASVLFVRRVVHIVTVTRVLSGVGDLVTYVVERTVLRVEQ